MKRLLILALTLGACSVSPSENALNTAIADAMAQLGDVSGMTEYTMTKAYTNASPQMIQTTQSSMFVSSDKINGVAATLMDGAGMNNVIGQKIAMKASLVQTAISGLTFVESDGSTSATPQTGYTHVYTVTQVEDKNWDMDKNEWSTDASVAGTKSYYLVKIADNKINLVSIESTSTANQYKIADDAYTTAIIMTEK